jgi:hypothetical protein
MATRRLTRSEGAICVFVFMRIKWWARLGLNQ